VGVDKAHLASKNAAAQRRVRQSDEEHMVNRGDGGARRPAPPSARPAARPRARPAIDDDSDEKTNAINLADINLDDIDEAPLPASLGEARPATAPPARGQGRRDLGEDDTSETTNAFNLSRANLDDLEEAPPRRPAPSAPGRPVPPSRQPPAAPAPERRPAPAAARPQPGRPAPRQPPPPPSYRPPRAAAFVEKEPSFADEDDEKTSALSLDASQLEAMRARRAPLPVTRTLSKPGAPASAPERPATRAPAPPVRAAAQAPAEPVVEKTMAVSLEEFQAKHTPELPRALGRLAKLKHEPPAADRTSLVAEEDVPVIEAPAPKRFIPPAAQEPAARDGNPALVVRTGPDLGKIFPLSKDLTLVGRGLDADVVINDASASRKHFNIVRTLSGWKLVDLGSGNGTKVDGNRVSDIAMRHGMRIEAGGTTLEWVQEARAGAGADGGGKSPRAMVEAPEAAPKSLPPTGMLPVLDEAPKPARRVQEGKPGQRKGDAARLDKLAEEELRQAKAGKLPPPSDEKTSFGDIQALEIDPEWEARRLKQRRDGVHAPEDVKEEVQEVVGGAAKKGSAGKKIAIAGIIIGLLGGGFVAADKFAGLGIIFPKSVPVGATKDKDKDKAGAGKEKKDKDKPDLDDLDKEEAELKRAKAGEIKEAAKGKVGAAKRAATEKRWIAARNLYAAAVALDELVDGGDAGLAQAEGEVKALTLLVESRKAADKLEWAAAVKGLEQIKEGSGHFAAAQELLKIAKENAAIDELVKARERFATKDLAGAKAAISAALEYAGGYGEGTAFKEAIERAMAPDAALTELDPSDPNAKNPPKAQPSDLKAGLDAYAKGDFQAVINAFDGVAYGGSASRADVATAKAWSAAATTFDEAMKQVAASAGKPLEQLGYLRSARRADAIMGGAQKAKVAAESGKAWAALAKEKLAAKDFAAAGQWAKLALGIDPGAADAKEVQSAVVKDTTTWVAEGKGVKDAPDKAAELFARALRALPLDDPGYSEADKSLAELLKAPE